MGNKEIQNEIKKRLLEGVGELVRGGEVYEERDMLCLDISGEDIQKVASLLKLGEGLEFGLLVDILGIDYSEYGAVRNKASDERYAVVYIFYSLIYDLRLKVRSFVKCAEKGVPTICGIYKGAILTEREVYDMYGINFVGHPDLKRLLMPEDYEGYPLRKDYPLRGRGERSSFPKYNIYNKLKGQVDGSG